MQLINTIEISPYDYSEKEYQSPNGSWAEMPEEWNNFWLKCISDSNIGNLKSIYKGSYLVDIETIGDLELETIIKAELRDIDINDFAEQVIVMTGGIVLLVGNKTVLIPTCCGDIGNLANWEEIFNADTNCWKQLWIGILGSITKDYQGL